MRQGAEGLGLDDELLSGLRHLEIQEGRDLQIQVKDQGDGKAGIVERGIVQRGPSPKDPQWI